MAKQQLPDIRTFAAGVSLAWRGDKHLSAGDFSQALHCYGEAARMDASNRTYRRDVVTAASAKLRVMESRMTNSQGKV